MADKSNLKNIGLGCLDFSFVVYIANRPNMSEYNDGKYLQSLNKGDITSIGLACGNGWRKVFNVYSKLLYALDPKQFSFQSLAPTWQIFRDDFLLQNGSKTALLFSAPLLPTASQDKQYIHIVTGKTYAKNLINKGELTASLIWLDEDFAIDLSLRLIVCPYFDYRQLSNQKIERLSLLISEIINHKGEIA